MIAPLSVGPADKMTIGVFKKIHNCCIETPLSEEVITNIRNSENYHGIICYMNGDVAIGEVAVSINKDILEIVSLAVLPVYRKIGVATKLLEEIVKTQPKAKSISIKVPESDEALNKLFAKVNYEKASAADGFVVYTKNIN